MNHRLRWISVLPLLGFAAPSARAQCVVQELSSTEQVASGYQNRISLHGDTVLVASGYEAALVFERAGDGWVESARLTSPDEAWVVRSLELSDGVAAVCSSGGSGGVYVFEIGPRGWELAARLQPFVTGFHYEVATLALTRDVLAIGDRWGAQTGGRGAVWVYERVGGQWRHSTVLLGSGGGSDDDFGVAVAADERTILASSWDAYGRVHVFDRGADGWHQTARIDGTLAAETFGFSIALSRGRALVGSRSPFVETPGRALLFQRRGPRWEFTTELAPHVAIHGDDFGWSVDIDGDRAVVGSVGFVAGKGRAVLFEEREGAWHEIAVLLPVHEPTGDTFVFGYAVSVSGENAAATNLAHSYVYNDFDCAAVVEYCAASQNSTFYEARMRHAGSLRVSDNDFELRASHCPSGEIGFFFYGPTPAQLPFGAGWLCVGAGPAGLFRFPPQVTDFELTRREVDFTEPPANHGAGRVVAGSTWYFQFAFRDGTNFDFTDGLRVLFGP